jgi:hypothetical protein
MVIRTAFLKKKRYFSGKVVEIFVIYRAEEV